MTHKVLLADDSLTIQKVIKITLANEPYSLLDCRTENDLMTILERESPHLVLLDFSLSESRSGYELCKLIRSKNVNTAVLMMYGTFDTVDENALKNCGAKGKIIKPFDSGKFINLCKSLVEELEGATQVSSALENSDEVFAPRKEEEMSWEMDAPTAPEKNSGPDIKPVLNDNALEDEMKAWGMSLPERISGGGEIIKFPPKIEKQPLPSIVASKLEEELVLPTSSDLEFPDLSSPIIHNAIPVTEFETPSPGPRSKLISLSELIPVSDNELSFDESSNSYELSLEEGTTSDEDIRKLEAAISDELEYATPKKVEDISTQSNNVDGMSLKNFADLWAADEIEDLNPTMKKQSSIINLEISDKVDLKLETQTEVIKEVTKDISDLSHDLDLEAKIREAVKPIIEQMVKDYCRQTLEKVAWEVIPDLAENLIKKELQKISDSLIGE
ncbi:MAG: response regulator [Bacteriovoracaceae bacterium]